MSNEIQSRPLKNLDNASLLTHARKIAAEERHLMAELLKYLGEIEHRRLYALMGYSSLFAFVTQELHYSEAAAQRRIVSMRLVSKMPELKDKIESGALNLTNIAQAEKFFKNEEKSDAALTEKEKKVVLQDLENKSTRDAERHLVSISKNPDALLPPERTRPVSKTHTEIRFNAAQDLMEKMELIRGLLAHKNSRLTMAELFSEISSIALETLTKKKGAGLKEKTQKNFDAGNTVSETKEKSGAGSASSETGKSFVAGSTARETKEKSGAGSASSETEKPAGAGSTVSETKEKFVAESVSSETRKSSGAGSTTSDTRKNSSAEKTANITSVSRYIPAQIRRAVYSRDQGMCTYLDPGSNRKCGSKFQIEYDHVVPYAMGGSHSEKNIRLRCRVHNSLYAAQIFGEAKVDCYRKNSR